MKNEMNRFDELLEKWCEGTLLPFETRELDSLLLENPELRIRYTERMELHARLARLLGTSTDSPRSSSVETKLVDGSGHGVRSTQKGLYALMAAVAVCLVGIFIWQNRDGENFAARIIKKIDCEIESNRWENEQSDEIEAGRVITLSRGLLALEFACGATVAIEGPAEFQVVSADKGFLYFGKLSANTPARAQGFTIETPSCESVDLGTEFGVSVDEQGISETHVFNGEVLVYDRNQTDKSIANQLRLASNRASRINDSLSNATLFESRPKTFLRMDLPDAFIGMNNDFQINEKDKLVLWLDASKRVQTDDHLRIVSWGDLAVTDNRNEENAWQVDAAKRPYMILDAINGHAAVRFMGREHLVTEPLTTGDNFTVFVVGTMLPNQLRIGQQTPLLEFGSPRSFSLFRNQKNNLVSKVFGNWRAGKQLYSGWIALSEDVTEMPMVIGTVYNHQAGESKLIVNKELAGTADASIAAAIDKPRFIGCRFNGESGLVGDIAEIMVFDSALDDHRIDSISDWLLTKYSIAPGGFATNKDQNSISQ